MQSLPGAQIGRPAEVTAPALTVLVVILFMWAVSGAHRMAPSPRVHSGPTGRRGLAATLLRVTFGAVAHLGVPAPGLGFSTGQAFTLETVMTLALVSDVLGAAVAYILRRPGGSRAAQGSLSLPTAQPLNTTRLTTLAHQRVRSAFSCDTGEVGR